jgi:hypothetical protein
MHSHHITSALADARVAELQRRATPPAAPRRHRRALALLAVAATAALAPGSASAQPSHDAGVAANTQTESAPAPEHRTQAMTPSPAGTADASIRRAERSRHAAQVRQDLRPPDVRDAAKGRGTFNSPQVVVVKAPSPTIRPTPASGMDWADAGIGAGSLLALSVIVLGGTLLILHRRRTTHDAHPAGL